MSEMIFKMRCANDGSINCIKSFITLLRAACCDIRKKQTSSQVGKCREKCTPSEKNDIRIEKSVTSLEFLQFILRGRQDCVHCPIASMELKESLGIIKAVC